MLLNQVKSMNFSAVSAINVEEGKGDPILYLNANINNGGDISFSEQIRDKDSYKNNIKIAEADRKTFQENVMKYVDMND